MPKKVFCKDCIFYQYGYVNHTYANGTFKEWELVCIKKSNIEESWIDYQTGLKKIIYKKYFSNRGDCKYFRTKLICFKKPNLLDRLKKAIKGVVL